MYYFIRFWISQRSKIKLYRLCMMNLIIEKRMWCLLKYHNIINERRYIRMLRDTCLHIMSVSYEQINNKIRNYILSEYQSCEKRLLLMLFIYYIKWCHFCTYSDSSTINKKNRRKMNNLIILIMSDKVIYQLK